MEQEKGRLSLLRKGIFLIYVIGCLFFLFKNNPYLYSTETLKSVFHKEKGKNIHTVPDTTGFSGDEEELTPTSVWRLNRTRSGTFDAKTTFNRKYEKLWNRELWVDGDPSFKKAKWSRDDVGYYLIAGTQDLVATDHAGFLKWKLHLDDENSQFKTLPALTKTRVYATTSDGRVFCLDKANGRILWTVHPVKGTRGAPIIADGQLYFFGVEEEELKKRTRLFSANPWTGEVKRLSTEDVGPITDYPPTISNELKALYVGSEAGNLFALNYETGKLLFKTSTADKILSAITLADNKAMFTTMDGKLVAVEAKSGTMAWETDLESPSDSTATYIPDYKLVAVMTNNGYLQTVDVKTGERKWKFLTHSTAPLHSTLTLRLKGKWIEEHDMKWRYRGWVLLAPCATKRICIYNPERGQIVGRVYLDGPVTSEPVFDGKEFVVSVLVTDKDSGEESLQLVRFAEKKNKASKPPTTPAADSGQPSGGDT